MRAKAAWAMAAMGSAAADYMAVITMAVKVRDLFLRLLQLGFQITVFPPGHRMHVGNLRMSQKR